MAEHKKNKKQPYVDDEILRGDAALKKVVDENDGIDFSDVPDLVTVILGKFRAFFSWLCQKKSPHNRK